LLVSALEGRLPVDPYRPDGVLTTAVGVVVTAMIDGPSSPSTIRRSMNCGRSPSRPGCAVPVWASSREGASRGTHRNGGLFIDTGVLAFRDPDAGSRRYNVDSPLVIEWRALTVALLDRLAALVRQRLGRDAVALPLPRILQGGTWAAGRAIARRLRPDGSAPVQVISDGTVF